MNSNPKSKIQNPKSPVFLVGPVLSRRLGRSIGVDLLRGECTFLCPYCEVRVHHVDALRLIEFKPTAALYAEYARFCRAHGPADLDSVTFSGTGEPTLISNLGDILRTFKKLGPYPLTVITNGSLLWMPRVRENLRLADLVVPSLDAVTDRAWRKVNRPHPGLTLDRYLDGARQFCAEHPGKIWMEVLLVRRINDSIEDVDALARFLRTLRLDRVQIGTVDRPPAKSQARPVPAARLAMLARRVARQSGHAVDVIVRPREMSGVSSKIQNPKSKIAGRILRSVSLRPQSPAELRRSLLLPKSNFDRAVRELLAGGRMARVRFGRRVFLQSAPGVSSASA